MKINKNHYLLLTILFLFTTSGFSQTKVIWELSKDQSVIGYEGVVAKDQRLSNLKVAGYISAGAQRTLPEDLTWPAEKSANKERFIEYSLSPEKASKLNIKEISLALSFNSSSAGMVDIAWSTDGSNYTIIAENQKLQSGSIPKEYMFSNLDIPLLENQTFYLRIYPWTTSVISSKYLISKNVSINTVLKN